MREEIKANLEMTNDWLKFGEAKNAALIAFNGATCLGLIDKIWNAANLDCYLRYYLYCIILFSFISSLIGVISFIPATRIKFHPGNSQISPSDNLTFFGHISKYESLEYVKALAGKLGNTSYQVVDIDVDLANQLITNSKITMKKYNFFKTSVWISLCGFLTPVIALILYLTIDSEK